MLPLDRVVFNVLLLLCSVTPSLAEEIINFDESTRSCIAHHASDWGYYGQVSLPLAEQRRKPILLPNDWGQQHPSCGRARLAMHRQSPVEIPADLPTQAVRDVVFPNRCRAHFTIEHNCHTVQATLVTAPRETEPMLRVGDRYYRLLQFHIHTPSEHVFDTGGHGVTNYPAELHFVHAVIDARGQLDSSHLAVIALFFDFAPTPEQVDHLADLALTDMANTYQGSASHAVAHAEPVRIDVSSFWSGHEHGYYRYAGSLTTPPCSEIVEWIVLSEPLMIATSTFRLLQEKKLDVGFANIRPAFRPTPAHELRRHN